MPSLHPFTFLMFLSLVSYYITTTLLESTHNSHKHYKINAGGEHVAFEAQYGDLHMQFTTCTGTNLSGTIYKSLQHKGHRVSSGLVASNETMRVYM